MATAINKGVNNGISGGLIPGIASWLGGDDPNPADEANKTLDQIPGQIKQYYTPYIDAGTKAIPGFQDIMAQLMKDPTKIMQMLGQGYKQSPGYDWNLKQGENAITNANAAGGMLGTPQHEQQAGAMATNLASQDYDKYMQNIMKMFGIGAEGTSSLIQGGQKAGSSLADAIASILGQKAAYNFAGTAGQNASNSQNNSNLISSISSIAGSLLG